MAKTQSIARIRMRARCEELWLEGHSVKQISEITGYKKGSVHAALKYMSERLIREQDKELERKRAEAQARKEHLLRETMNAFKLSQNPAKETRTEYKRVECPGCNGEGRLYIEKDDDYETCEQCEGKKAITVEIITEKVAGQAGDAALLNVARNILADIDKISGIQAAREIKMSGKVEHEHSNKEDSPYADMPIEQLEALQARLEEAKASIPKISSTDAVDVEFEVKDKDGQKDA